MSDFDPERVNLTEADPTDIICYLSASENDYDGRLGARISALFVILVVSTAATVFPVLAKRVPRLRIPLYVYLFARYFGAGVIIATAFMHLLDPAYDEIGPATCVGSTSYNAMRGWMSISWRFWRSRDADFLNYAVTGGWAEYSWPPALALTSVMVIFLVDFVTATVVDDKYRAGRPHSAHVEDIVAGGPGGHVHESRDEGDVISEARQPTPADLSGARDAEGKKTVTNNSDVEFCRDGDSLELRDFQEQIAAFLVLEFGVIFHSVIIGLNLGVTGDEFSSLYPVLVFHQSFEGLGIGARLSDIPFPQRLRSMPWILCAAYGLTTPISIAIGLGLRTTYNSGSFAASIVSGVLDSLSAGILMWTGLVEMLARDFIFNPNLTRDKKRRAFMIVSLLLGTLLMALLGKWA